MNAEELIQSLIESTTQTISQAEKLKMMDTNTLTWRKSHDSWNMLECLEHLNLYGDFYLPEIESKIKKSNTEFEAEFKSGLIGNYFAQSMLPKDKLNKMKTFKDKNPLNEKLDKDTIDRFIDQQIRLIQLLDLSRHVNLNKVKINISISRFITLKLGDTFRFYTNHINRHFRQIDRIRSSPDFNECSINAQ
jgi:hypothetical protein